MSKKKIEFEGHLPNGKLTHSHKTYLRHWRALARPFERVFGMKLSGIEPGILLSGKNGTFSIGTHDAIQLLKGLPKQAQEIEKILVLLGLEKERCFQCGGCGMVLHVTKKMIEEIVCPFCKGTGRT